MAIFGYSLRNPFFQKSKSCLYKNAKECPYNFYNACGRNLLNCNHSKRTSKDSIIKEKTKSSKSRIFNFLTVGIILFLVSQFNAYDYNPWGFQLPKVLEIALSSLSISLVAGAIVTFAIDLPSNLKSFDDYFIESITSDKYLKWLDKERLSTLRQEVTKQLHKKTTPKLSTGLIELDDKICNLMNEPYYSFYIQNVEVSMDPEKKYFIKKNYVRYKLINPYGKNRTYTEPITQTSSQISIEGVPDKELITYSEIKFIVDDLRTIDYSQKHSVSISKIDSPEDYYDRRIELKDKDEKDYCKIEFADNVVVTLKFTVKTPIGDTCFTKRLKHPAKHFNLGFSLDMEGYKPVGETFGTEIGVSSSVINQHNKRNLTLISPDWMLPNNGAYVVLVKE